MNWIKRVREREDYEEFRFWVQAIKCDHLLRQERLRNEKI